MSNSADLSDILKDWPYDPEKDARVIRGKDGRELLQVRTPLGIEQFEMEGRPDGRRPHGKESVLEYQQEKLNRAKAAGKEKEFELDEHDCAELFNEGTLYYLRYVRLFQLKDWPRTIRDTRRNLRCFDLVHEYAAREEDQDFLEKWRPYIIRINASAAAMLALEKQEFDTALKVVKNGVQQSLDLAEIEDDTFKFERERSVTALRELAAQIEKNRPMTELEKLERHLKRAIERQEFEKAAGLRDRIRALRQQQTC
jgi:hypothetical protein